MLTPVDIQNKSFKGGIGFDKKDVEAFMHQLSSDYGELYRSNVELKDKVNTLNESLQHYKTIEDSMQKALTISEKTSEETINAATDKARQITNEAELKATQLLADSKAELQETQDEIYRLKEQLRTFKEQFSKILNAELKMLDGEIIDIDLGDAFTPSAGYTSSSHSSYPEGGLGGDGGLGAEGGLGSGGGYTGNNPSNFEKNNQEPSIERSSLNMDPFANASNGGRFSKQTGGNYNQSSTKGSISNSSLKTSSSKDSGKSSLNIKQSDNNSSKIKRGTRPIPTAVNQSTPKVNPEPSPKQSVTGDVETKVKESNMIDSEDNYSTGFNFVNEESATSQESTNYNNSNNDTNYNETLTGDIENKVNESNMIDSEDNYNTGFDFVDEDLSSTGFVSDSSEPLTGEVESKVNESNMIDSEDNYNTGFDFITGNEEYEDDIPTIFSGTNSGNSNFDDDTVFVGDVEDKINDSHLIGNDDDDDSGFNFL